MPELPEVETVRLGLSPVMEGALIVKADVRRPDLRWPFPERMAERLGGATVVALRRRAKYILADLSGGESLLIHLGMSGRMVICGAGHGRGSDTLAPLEKHDHVVFYMSNGARITFNDPRRFGAMDLLPTAQAAQHPLLAHLGPEPLSNAFHEDYLVAALRARASPIKTALLDQRIIAGLGNIYVCEALYRARINPACRAKDVPRAALRVLVGVIPQVLREAIDAGGSSLRDHRQADGSLGYFQHGFQVYGREGAPCLSPECSATIERFVQSGRSTFLCPSCQS